MRETVEQFIHRVNAEILHRQLRFAADDARKKQLLTLLAEEVAKGRKAGWPPLKD